jgi:hypothetical protein
MNDVVTFINHLANQSREDGAVTVEDTTYLTEEFPVGFWRKLAKEVNYISTSHVDSNFIRKLTELAERMGRTGSKMGMENREDILRLIKEMYL